MPRDVNGNVTPPPGTIVNSGDAILPSQHNPVVTDYAAMLEQSLSRDGQGGMRAPLNMSGFKITNVGTATNPNDAVSMSQAASFGTPVGAILDYAGTNIPEGWMACYGQSLSRTAYPALFAAIGTTYGAPSGSTFSLPDCRGRVTACRDLMGSSGNANRLSSVISNSTILGATGGDQLHTLTVAQMPAHSHSGTTSTNGAHSHSMSSGDTAGWGTNVDGTPQSNRTLSTNSAGAHNHTFTTSSQGGGAAHPNVQPTILFNKIIKVQ